MSPFTNPIVGGTALVRPAIKSPNYVPGVSGWSINRDGSAEFRDLTARATILLGTPGGARIELDGTNGKIQIYDAGNHLIAEIKPDGVYLAYDTAGNVRVRVNFSGAGSVEFGSGDASELLLGDVQAFVLGAGATRQEALVIESGMFAGGNRPSITLSSDSFDVTVLSRIEHLASLHNFLGAISIDSQVDKEKAWHQVGAGGEPAFAGNWANFGGSDQAAAFRLGIKNDVELTGLVKSTGALGAAPSTIFTLPVAYRPANLDISRSFESL